MKLALVLLVLLTAAAFGADYETPTSTVTVDVKNVVPNRKLAAREIQFLAKVPERDEVGNPGFREAVRQMLLADVIHVPLCGQYNGDSVRYWSMYQVWTARKVVQVPIVQGPPGPPGPPGELLLVLPEREERTQLVLSVSSGPQAGRYQKYQPNGWETFWGTVRFLIPVWAASEIRPSRTEITQANTQTGGPVTQTGGGATSSSSSSSASSSSAAAAAAAEAD